MYYFTFQQIFLIDSQIKLYILHIHTEPRISLSKYTIHFTNTPLFFLYSIHFGILTFFFIWKRCTNAIFYTISLNFLGENKHSYSKTKKEKKKKNNSIKYTNTKSIPYTGLINFECQIFLRIQLPVIIFWKRNHICNIVSRKIHVYMYFHFSLAALLISF